MQPPMLCKTHFIALAFACLLFTGCNGSRWAKSDLVYARKYPNHSDNVVKMAKQAIDARQVAGRSGFYIDGHGGGGPAAGGASLGAYHYHDPPKLRGAIETRLGFAALGVNDIGPSRDQNQLSGGFELGARVQTPTRLAPFAGIGGYMGLSEESDYEDELLAAIYPEIGIHYWVNPNLRITGFARHYFASNSTFTNNYDSGSREYQTFGVSLAFLGGAENYVPPTNCPSEPNCTSQVGDPANCPDAGYPNADCPGTVRQAISSQALETEGGAPTRLPPATPTQLHTQAAGGAYAGLDLPPAVSETPAN